MRVADASWKVVELDSVRVTISLPRVLTHVVTDDGQVVPGLRDQQPPRYIEGRPLHWPQCQAA